jgi:hypothetical protein
MASFIKKKKRPVGPILELESILTLKLSELEEIETKKHWQYTFNINFWCVGLMFIPSLLS